MVEVDCDISKIIYQRFQKHQYDIGLIMEPERSREDRDSRDYRIDELAWIISIVEESLGLAAIATYVVPPHLSNVLEADSLPKLERSA